MSATASLTEHEQREFSNLLFGVRRSIRYHNRRRRFFDGLDKVVKVLAVIGGSAAWAATIAHYHTATVWFAAIVAIGSAISLVFAPSQAARLHEGLAKRFAKLEYDMRRAKNPTSDQMNEFVAERLLIESDEPPPLRVLDIICHNELCEAMGHERCHFYKVGWFQSLLAPFIDFRASKIKKEQS
jgi:hypothetical protein